MTGANECVVRLITRAADLDAATWNACAGEGNPFLTHAFITALEDSHSAVAETGWQPAHIVLDDAKGSIAAIAPGYAKSHSQGEYVFDHGWADAFERAGGRYYPKFQMSVPFTPATGPRLLLRDDVDPAPLIHGIEMMCEAQRLSSAHATFITEPQVADFRNADWLIRHGEQFHWFNDDYHDFDAFLGALTSRKRKTIRRERRDAGQSGLDIRHVRGADITESDWDAFWLFYQDTGARKWGRPYLTRGFFSLISERMADRILLIFAYDGDTPVAGALNFIGDDCLYGRYWGTRIDLPFLHFELCYYQAIEFAIANRLKRVEAGAQGPHKLARGYLPVTTYSAHYIVNPSLRAAIEDYLARERAVVDADIAAMRSFAPYRRDGKSSE